MTAHPTPHSMILSMFARPACEEAGACVSAEP
jgi:hypothetical protein